MRSPAPARPRSPPARPALTDLRGLRVTDGPIRRSIGSRVGQAAAAVGICLAITTAVTVTGASATQRSARAGGRLSVTQLNRQIGALEAKGYLPVSCTTKGTLLRNAKGQSKTINW